jgi:hypothetical protein
MRVAVKGDILGLGNPASTWLTHFKPTEKFDVSSLGVSASALRLLTSPSAFAEVGARPRQVQQGRDGPSRSEPLEEGATISLGTQPSR